MPVKKQAKTKRAKAKRTTDINVLRGWLKLASEAERAELAKIASVSKESLPSMAGGFRRISAEVASALERASKILNVKTKGRLPILYRIDLNAACHSCIYARSCLPPGVVIASEFPLVSKSK